MAPREYHSFRYVIIFFLSLLVTGCAQRPEYNYQGLPSLNDEQRSAVVIGALALMDSPYQYAGAHPSTGFDCSGLVYYVFAQHTPLTLPRNSSEQAQLGKKIRITQLQAGDLVFFNTLGNAASHVGIYIGQGQFVNAPSSGGKVRIDSLENPYFKQRFSSASRLFEF